jgi:orotidine-5'-phosphate decarboxylase
MKAAAEGRAGVAETSLRLLAVTILTSYEDEDVRQAGYRCDVEGMVIDRFIATLV